MESIESQVKYFINLVDSNMKLAKDKNEEIVFCNIDMLEEGQEIKIHNIENNEIYKICKKDIDDTLYCLSNSINAKIQELALVYIDRLIKYSHNEISFKKLEGDLELVNILMQKDNISEQFKLLHSHRNIPAVQEYIRELENSEYTSEYIKYLIDKYYYNKKDLTKPKKNDLESFCKLKLRIL